MGQYTPPPASPAGGSRALRVVFVYAIFAALWILLSDKAVSALFHNPADITRVSMLKGWFFVAVTSLLLYGLVRQQIASMEAAARREMDSQAERLHTLQLLEAIANNSEDAIFAKDMEGRYILFNRAAGRFVGKAPEEVLGQDDFLLFPPDQAQSLQEFGRRVIRENRNIIYEELVTTPAGETSFSAVKGPLVDPLGKVYGTFGISRDITAAKRNEARRLAAEEALRHSEQRLRSLFDALPDLVWLKDVHGTYLACNPRFEAFFGASEADIVGRSDHDFVSVELADFFCSRDKAAIEADRPVVYEEEVSFASDGHRERLQTIKLPYRDADGRLIGVLGIARDISERSRNEEELRRSNEELQRFNKATVGRELDMIELKKQVNALSAELGRVPPYRLDFLDNEAPRSGEA